jgi:hypothetical protein
MEVFLPGGRAARSEFWQVLPRVEQESYGPVGFAIPVQALVQFLKYPPMLHVTDSRLC